MSLNWLLGQMKPRNRDSLRNAVYIMLMLLVATSSLHVSSQSVARAEDLVVNSPELQWKRCGERLVTMSGRSLTEVSLDRIEAASVDSSPEFLMQLLALIYVESRFNPRAISGADARGYTQITKVAVMDAAEYCGLPRRPKDLYDVDTNVRYGSCYLEKLRAETGDWLSSYIAYNGGYQAFTKFQKGEQLGTETSNYALQLMRIRALCN